MDVATQTGSGRWIGTPVANTDLAGFVQVNGPPVHTKPHGEGVTIVYYVNPNPEEANPEEFHDYAGTKTPGAATMIAHYPTNGVAIEPSSQAINTSTAAPSRPPMANAASIVNKQQLIDGAEIVDAAELSDKLLNSEQQNQQEEAEPQTFASPEHVDLGSVQETQQTIRNLPPTDQALVAERAKSGSLDEAAQAQQERVDAGTGGDTQPLQAARREAQRSGAAGGKKSAAKRASKTKKAEE